MKYLILDVETIGGSPKTSKMTEIAMYLYDGKKIIDQFETLINPESPIPRFITGLTGINDEMVKNAPKFHEIAKKIIKFSKGAIFVAHNVSFDYGMIRSEFRSLGYDFRMPHLCTVKSARKILPGKSSYSLGKLCRELDIKLSNRHRAIGDAQATVKLFKIMFEKDQILLNELIEYELNPKYTHPNLDYITIDDLPTKTGVYRFYNEFNQIIYIGKSINIKKRVKQHLQNRKNKKAIQLSKDIARVEYELCGSELIALLKESELIKKHQTSYNRSLKISRFLFGIYDDISDNGYIHLLVDNISKRKSSPLLYFSTKKDGAEYLKSIREEYQLCDIYCSSKKDMNKACFYYEIKSCNGACIMNEDVETYNNRVQIFIDKLSYKHQRFYLVGKGRDKTEKSLVLIENGTYRGYGFAPYHFNHLTIDKWYAFIESKKEDKDSKILVNNYIKKNKKDKIFRF